MPRGKVLLILSLLALVLFVVSPGFDQLKQLVQVNLIPDRSKSAPSISCAENIIDQFSSISLAYRHCLLGALRVIGESAWDRTHVAVELCLNKTMWTKLDVRTLDTSDADFKFVVLASSNDTNSPCTVVTLGVGNDISAEEKLRKLASHCKFYGADPISKSGQVYQSIGQYFEIAVGSETGVMKASVYEDGVYNFKQVPTLNLEEFLRKNINQKRIDYFWVDTEGSEYKMLTKYFVDSKLKDVSICQMAIELHGPLEKYDMNKKTFSQFLIDFTSKSDLLPIWSRFDKGHVRAFYLNLFDDYCLKKFVLPKFCTNG